MKFSWRVEKEIRNKKADWYLVVGIIALAIAGTAIIFNNILLAVIIVVGFIVLVLNHSNEPEIYEVDIDERGIRLNNLLFPFSSLESFNIEEDLNRLYIKSKRLLSPHIVIPIPDDVDHEGIHDFLLERLELEDDLRQSIFEEFMEYLGF